MMIILAWNIQKAKHRITSKSVLPMSAVLLWTLSKFGIKFVTMQVGPIQTPQCNTISLFQIQTEGSQYTFIGTKMGRKIQRYLMRRKDNLLFMGSIWDIKSGQMNWGKMNTTISRWLYLMLRTMSLTQLLQMKQKLQNLFVIIKFLTRQHF